VRAYQYPLVGGIVLKTFELCLGELWDEQTRLSWIKIFSKVISFIVPAALQLELEMGAQQVDNSTLGSVKLPESVDISARLSVQATAAQNESPVKPSNPDTADEAIKGSALESRTETVTESVTEPEPVRHDPGSDSVATAAVI
jgi:hypothetical protein